MTDIEKDFIPDTSNGSEIKKVGKLMTDDGRIALAKDVISTEEEDYGDDPSIDALLADFGL